jgi:hypothetical protein
MEFFPGRILARGAKLRRPGTTTKVADRVRRNAWLERED